MKHISIYMHYFIYKTTNLDNGKYYIGQHITEDMGDGYLGSGRRLKLAIKKHGKENFVREVIAIAESPEQLNALESFYVGWEQVNDKNCYNLMTGGGSIGKRGKETRQKMSVAQKGKKLSAETRKKICDAMKGQRCGENNPNFGKKFSAETRQKMSAAHEGENNPHFKPLSQEAKDILLSMTDFIISNPDALVSRLRKHKINAGPLAISLFQQEITNFS